MAFSPFHLFSLDFHGFTNLKPLCNMHDRVVDTVKLQSCKGLGVYFVYNELDVIR